jgi:hypothetical protein
MGVVIGKVYDPTPFIMMHRYIFTNFTLYPHPNVRQVQNLSEPVRRDRLQPSGQPRTGTRGAHKIEYISFRRLIK